MYQVFDIQQLRNESYIGEAWNVYYEFSYGHDLWDYDGKDADKLDAFFKTEAEAREFADERFPDDIMENKLISNLVALDVTEVILAIEQYFFEEDSCDSGNVIYSRSYALSGGSIVKNDSNWFPR